MELWEGFCLPAALDKAGAQIKLKWEVSVKSMANSGAEQRAPTKTQANVNRNECIGEG